MPSIAAVIRKLPRIFWISNLMELFERWAWYGFYNSLALYLTMSRDTGALGFTDAQKGIIIGTGSMLLYFLPLITGAIADRVGYKKILLASFLSYIAGYFMMGHFQTFGWVFFAYIFLATAGALFKPIISAVVAKTTDEETSSIGFGIFYMMVNIGGFIGPFIAGMVYKLDWDYVFYLSMGVIAINFFIALYFFHEPSREESDEPLGRKVLTAFRNILVTLSDWKYVIFLLIMVLFWTAFNQLYYTFPTFINDWVDFDKLNASLSWLPWKFTPVGITSLDAFFIIVLQLFISSLAMRFKPLHAMIVGFLILSAGLFFMFSTRSGWGVIFGLLVFSIGEMAASPKFTEYVGRIAPADKKALYMGTSFLPIAAAHFLAGILSGKTYSNIGSLYTLLQKEVAARGLSLPEVGEHFTKNDYIELAATKMQMSREQLTRYLWDHYHPDRVWLLYAGVAVSAALLLFLYDRLLLKGADMRNHES